MTFLSRFNPLPLLALVLPLIGMPTAVAQKGGEKRLEQLLKKYPAADANQDGKLTWQEAKSYQQKMLGNQRQQKQGKKSGPAPTHENIQYGPFERNVLDLWIPESDQPTPLLVYIHGGGFTGGNKESVRGRSEIQAALDHHVAFASIQYRLRYPDNGDTSDPQRTGIQNILRDSARSLQYLRHHAAKYNLDPKRIACYGGSAGAGTSLWLAVHDDLADPDNEDPVLRQSSRILAAGMLNGQFTYDLTRWDPAFKDRDGDIVKTHGRNGVLEGHKFYGLTPEEFAGAPGQAARADVDMEGLITADDPPIFVLTSTADVKATNRGIYNHHPRHGELIEKKCGQVGVECLCLLPKARDADAKRMKSDPNLMVDFFLKHLNASD